MGMSAIKILKPVYENAIDYSLDSIKYMCDKIGPRESGMPNERKAQEWLKKELLSNEWADEAEMEEFTVSRHGLVGFSKIVAVMLLLAVALSITAYFAGERAAFIINLCTIILPVLSLLMALFELMLYKPFVDPFLPKTKSSNVYAKYHSAGETKRRIIFSGHCDSAYEWTLVKIAPVLLIIALAGSFIGGISMLALIGISLGTGMHLWLVIVTAVFAPFYFMLFFMCKFKTVVPGANDNLTGVFAALSALKCLKESGIRFENTEVAALLTGSEESGLRGAKAWAKKHKKEIEESGIDTVFISLETFRDWDCFCIYTRDMTMTVPHDKGVIKLLDKACRESGRTIKQAMVPFGASDAAAVTQAKLRAGCIAGMDPKPAPYYHNMKDTPDNMDRKSFAFGLSVVLEAAEIFDRDGAPQ
jgi:hypothetical protein